MATSELVDLRIVKISGDELASLSVDKAFKVCDLKADLDQKLDLGQAVKCLLLEENQLDDELEVGSLKLQNGCDITAIISDQVPEVFETHDNGGRPFQVEILRRDYQSGFQGNVKVYKNTYRDDTGFDKSQPVFEAANLEKVFVGKSPLNAMTESSGGHGPDFDGNSILVKQISGMYVFIGQTITSFQALAEIVEYVSPVGNNDVPYPFAVDSAGNHYLLIEGIIVSSVPLSVTDPYRYYYDNCAFKDMKVQVGKRVMSLRYTPYPTDTYNRFIPKMGPKMVLLKGGVETGDLSEEEFTDMMLSHGKLMQFRRLESNVLVNRF
jgi:hypothetical protein